MEKTTASESFFWIDSETTITSKDEYGNPAEGTRLFRNENGEEIITRWRDGLLDGDVVGEEGNLRVLPAVEAGGHVEYWRRGMLHRDGDLPAVSTSGFSREEWWLDNKRYR